MVRGSSVTEHITILDYANMVRKEIDVQSNSCKVTPMHHPSQDSPDFNIAEYKNRAYREYSKDAGSAGAGRRALYYNNPDELEDSYYLIDEQGAVQFVEGAIRGKGFS